MLNLRPFVFIVFVAFFIKGCSFFEHNTKEKEVASQAHEGIAYSTKFDESIDPKIVNYLEKFSALKRLEKRPPLTLIALQRRAEKDVKNFKEALGAIGHFEAKVKFQITEKSDHHQIKFFVTLGHVYLLSSVHVRYTDHPPLMELNLANDEGESFHIGEHVNLENLEKIAKRIVMFFKKHGYPYAKTFDIEGVPNKETQKLDATIAIFLGPQSSFGNTTISGLTSIDKTYVLNRLRWKESGLYNEEHVIDTKKSLSETGLFNSLIIIPKTQHFDEEESPKKSEAPMEITVSERKHRSIGIGGKYSSSEGVSAKTFWRHQNLLGGAEILEFSAQGGKRKNEIKAQTVIPDVLFKRHDFYTSIAYIHEITRAFTSKTEQVTFGFNYDVNNYVDVSYGISAETGKIKRNHVLTKDHLIGTPVVFQYDSTNDLLNPVQGMRFQYNGTPYFGKYQKQESFITNEGRFSFYIHPPLKIIEDSNNVLVIATWVHAGQATVHSYQDVPPTKRFYSGGGNSVRGYAYQLLGPLDNNNTPIGGKSIFECGCESRVPITEAVGAVAFIEAGSVGLSSFPKLTNGNIMAAAGFGLRYYTGVGPIRFDIGFPLKRRHEFGGRKKIDAPFQFYISMGQSF